MNLQPGHSLEVGLVGHQPEQEALEIWVASPHSPSPGDGHLNSGLVQVGKDLSFFAIDTVFLVLGPVAVI